MKLKYMVALLFISMATIAQAQIKTIAVKSGKTYARLLESDSQRTLPGTREAEVQTEYHFILVWKSEDAPQCFFWRGDGGWLSCSILKAHKMKGKNPALGHLPYKTERTSVDNIQKNDTLELTPVRGGKFPIPGDIPANSRNTLYFKTANTNWLSLYVKKIGRERDIVVQ